MNASHWLRFSLLALMAFGFMAPLGWSAGKPPAEGQKEGAKTPQEPRGFDPPAGATRLSPESETWVDMKKKQVIVDGRITLRDGLLEMFACIAGTKEHESVVGVNSRASVVHAALLSVGAEVGKPAVFEPKYQPATGTEVEVEVQWHDEQGKVRSTRAQNWIRDLQTNKPMAYNWVFSGSMFMTDPEDGKEYYLAEGGELLCVSNFATATLDLPIESTQANQGLTFTALAENIPPLGTKVRLVLKPKLTEKKPAQKGAPGKQPEKAPEKKPAKKK